MSSIFPYFSYQAVPKFICRQIQIILRLQPQPKTGDVPKKRARRRARVRRNASFSQYDFIDSPWRHPNTYRQLILAQPQRLQKFFHQDFPRKKSEQIELLELGRAGIHVAEYLTALPPKDVLKRKLHEAIARSRLAVENRGSDVDEAAETSSVATVKENLTVRQKGKKKAKTTQKPRGRDGE